MKRALRSLSSSFGVVPDAISEWKPDTAPHAIVMNSIGMAYHHLYALDEARKAYQQALFGENQEWRYGVVVGDLVGGNLGLGYLLAFGEGQANTAMVFVAILMLTVVGGIAYLAVILVEQRVLHYLPRRALRGV